LVPIITCENISSIPPSFSDEQPRLRCREADYPSALPVQAI
jgi:hypothetical protein